LSLLPKTLNAQLDAIACAQVDGWLKAETNSRRRPGGDDVAGSQAHETTYVADQIGDSEDHGSG